MISLDQLKAIMPRAGRQAELCLGPLNEAMAEREIDTAARIAPFLANVAHESGELRRFRENMNYRADRLLVVFKNHFDAESAKAYAGNPVAIANRVYANRNGNGDEQSGDGWKYIARGGIGITFYDNYRKVSFGLYGDGDILLARPELLEEPIGAMRSAAFFWWSNGLNHIADCPDSFDTVCDVINRGRKTARIGDANGYAERLAYFDRAKKVLA